MNIPLNTNVVRLSQGYDDEAFIKKWARLEENSLEKNMFLSPCFVIPSLRYLSNSVKPCFLAVSSGSGRLLGLAVFKECFWDRNYPMKHYQSYASKHTFLQGILVDKDYPEVVISALFRFIKSSNYCRPLKFAKIYGDGVQFQIMKQCISEMGGSWVQLSERRRAVLSINENRQNYFLDNFNSKQRSDIRRRKKRLSEMGTLEWRVYTEADDCRRSVSNFIRLENMGWKRERKTSLWSTSDNRDFFSEMSNRFLQANKMVCTELLLDGRAVSATNNYVSGDVIFAFKLGWDPELRSYSPNAVDLHEFTKYLLSTRTGFRCIDSGSTEGAYIEKHWKDKRILLDGFFTFNRTSAALMESVISARRLLKRVYGDGIPVRPAAQKNSVPVVSSPSLTGGRSLLGRE